MKWARWLQPPRNLLAMFLGLTLAPITAVGWLGWKLFEQDRSLEQQQLSRQIDLAADVVVPILQRSVSDAAQALRAGRAADPGEGAVIARFRPGVVDVLPASRLTYYPVVPEAREAPREPFHLGEGYEFGLQDYDKAISSFQALARSADPAIRAGAQLRLGRSLRKKGRFEEALEVYSRMAQAEGVTVEGVPAALVARSARCALLEEMKRAPVLKLEASALAHDLSGGRWLLLRPVYLLHASLVDRWLGEGSQENPGRLALAAVVYDLWEWWKSKEPSAETGRECRRAEGREITVLWRARSQELNALVAGPDFVERQWLAPLRKAGTDLAIHVSLRDASGRPLYGSAPHVDSPESVRGSSATGLPWTVAVAAADPGTGLAQFRARRRLLLGGGLLLLALIGAASYFPFRAVRRELAVAQMQSDFVSAVSHEFRTPLTSLRQFIDILREHRGLSEERRALCYEAQGRAADRLSRLVESLLDFGRMEAGARPYRLEAWDSAELVKGVVAEFQRQAEQSGYVIKLEEDGAGVVIDADREALGRALWNLLDNAVKYSPDNRSVRVSVARRQREVAISVADRGMGIPAAEQRAIFSKFHRGEGARVRGIKGTGIGLTIVQHIVAAHHGRVELKSETGAGSTFTIVLPGRG